MCDISTCQDIIFFHPNSNMPLLHFASSHEPSRKNIFFLEEKVNLMICREHISNMPTQKIQISYYYKTLSPVMGNTPWDKANDITNCKYLTSRYAD